MANSVIDSSAMLAYFRDIHGADLVEAAMAKATSKGTQISMPDACYAEMVMSIAAQEGPSALQRVKRALLCLPVTIVPTSREIAEQAGLFGHQYCLGLASAMALAVAHARRSELIAVDKKLSGVTSRAKVLVPSS